MRFVLYDYALSVMPEGAWRYFVDNLARFGDLATLLVKYEYFRNFIARVSRTNLNQDTGECSRPIGEIVNFALQALL